MPAELSGENVLVTGGAGFIGSAIVKRLLGAGNTVTVIDDMRAGSRAHLQDAIGATVGEREGIRLVEKDLRAADIPGILSEDGIGYVFHLAACPFVPTSYADPETVFDVNARGTLDLLLACADADVERVAHYSSSEVYGQPQNLPVDESASLDPRSTYGVSKMAADRLCYSLHAEHDLPVVILRQFNCYGPRATHPTVIPEIIAQLSRGNTVRLGNVDASRDFMYVDDAARAATRLITWEALEGKPVNVGSGEAHTIRDIVTRIGRIMGYEDVSIETEQERLRPRDIAELRCAPDRAQELLGSLVRTDIDDGLARTIDWYRQNAGWSWE